MGGVISILSSCLPVPEISRKLAQPPIECLIPLFESFIPFSCSKYKIPCARRGHCLPSTPPPRPPPQPSSEGAIHPEKRGQPGLLGGDRSAPSPLTLYEHSSPLLYVCSPLTLLPLEIGQKLLSGDSRWHLKRGILGHVQQDNFCTMYRYKNALYEVLKWSEGSGTRPESLKKQEKTEKREPPPSQRKQINGKKKNIRDVYIIQD